MIIVPTKIFLQDLFSNYLNRCSRDYIPLLLKNSTFLDVAKCAGKRAPDMKIFKKINNKTNISF